MPPQLSHSALLAAGALLDQPAIVSPDRTWTWRQVHEASIELSKRLGHATAVCNLCASRVSFLVTWLAALRSRALLVLPPSGGHADLAGVLKSTPRPIIVADHSQPIHQSWRSSAECLICPQIWQPSKASAKELAWQPDWDRTAILLYTSGSTGVPEPQSKTLLHLTLGAQVLGARLAREIAGGLSAVRRIVCSVPPQHMFGIEASVMLSLVHAIPVQEGRPLLPADVQQAFAGSSGTAWIATPLHLRGLVQSGEPLPNCNLVLASTMALTQPLAQQTEDLTGAPVLEIYGSTETGVLAMRRTAQEEAWEPVGGVRVESVSNGTLARGSHFRSPVRVADEIEIGATGTFRLLGRSADMIKIGGRRASLAGLNLLLQDLPGLEDGVFYLPAATNPTERLCLIYSGPMLDRARVEDWLRARVDSAFLPRTFIHVDKLPRLESGKLPRRALDALFAMRQRRAKPPGTAGGT
ncbi:MAG TPA: AMP-binding protein [Casimicrobiaceae bacterium]|nr:AMP-binding protein [Casimicrobiaceae bacterium]